MHTHPSAMIFQALRAAAIWLIAATLWVGASFSAQAQSIGIIRDAEVESLIADYAAPLLKVAGVRTKPRIYLVADRRFNAFVTEDGSIFVNYGTILDIKTPRELKGILAHEIGHLAGGHIANIKERAEVNSRLQTLALVLGVGAAAAASVSGGGGEIGEVASAFILASQSAGLNSLAAYRRSEESSADAAGLKFLAQAGQTAKGMVEVLTRLAEDQVARTGASGYLSTHPDPADRLDRVEESAKQSRHWGKSDNAADTKALVLAQAKLTGFLESHTAVLNRYPNSDKSTAARYARIIAAYKAGGGISALTQMPKLVAADPKNPFFHEILGQMYFETGNPAAAIKPLQRAVDLAPRETQIRTLYGHVLIETGNFEEATSQLSRATREEPYSARPFLLLSRAYAGLGKSGEASLAAAEAALAQGNKGTALGLAKQAQNQLTKSSPAWLRADDIILSLQ